MKKAPAYAVALLGLLGFGCGDGTDAVTGANGTSDPTTGTIHVSLVMTGGDMDPDGCSVTLDSGSAQQVNAGASVAFSHLPPGAHEVAIGDVAANCQVDGDTSRSVTVAAGESVQETFTVVCEWRSRIAFDRRRDGNTDIWVMNPDGTDLVQLTNHEHDDLDPIWSPDGTKIAFLWGCEGVMLAVPTLEVLVMNPDGTGLIQLTNDSWVHYPAWSPDGSRLAFMCGREICLIHSDGTGMVQLTNLGDGYRVAWQPVSWAPAGDRIAVTIEDPDRRQNIYVVSTDRDQVQLTTHPEDEGSPSWSPDGTRIAFVRDTIGDFLLYVMNPDGTDQLRLVSGVYPVWSPDGSRIISKESGLFSVNSDGTGLINLTDRRVSGHAAPSPDGTKIAFRCRGRTTWQVCAVNADGTGLVQLTTDEEFLCAWTDCAPSWSPDLY